MHARFLAGLPLGADVNRAGGIFSDEHERPARAFGRSAERATSAATSSRIAFAMAVPSRILALIGQNPPPGSPE